MLPVPTTQKGLGIDQSSMDDEKDLGCHSTSLVGDENIYRDTLSRQSAACADSQISSAPSSTAMTVLEQLSKDSIRNAIHVPPGVIHLMLLS
jgi:hypothetical protein